MGRVPQIILGHSQKFIESHQGEIHFIQLDQGRAIMRFLSFHTEGDSVDFPFISKKSQPERTGTTLTVYEYGKALRHMIGQLAQLREGLFDVPGAVFFALRQNLQHPPDFS